MNQEQLAALLKIIETKNSWGKNELKGLFVKACGNRPPERSAENVISCGKEVR